MGPYLALIISLTLAMSICRFHSAHPHAVTSIELYRLSWNGIKITEEPGLTSQPSGVYLVSFLCNLGRDLDGSPL